MKKLAIVLSLVLASGLVFASPITEFQVELGTAAGAHAAYTQSTGVINWTGGASGWFKLSDGSQLVFNQPTAGVTISGNFTGVNSLSSSAASFDSGWFKMDFHPYRGGSIVIEGQLAANEKYQETLGAVTPFGALLAGSAIVDVHAYVLDSNGHRDDTVYSWVVCDKTTMASSIVAPKTFGNYTSQNYDSNNLVVRVYADCVPEPATMSLLGLGAMALLRRRKA